MNQATPTEPDTELDNIVANLVFAGLSLEQMRKLPKWLLENVEKNKPTTNQALLSWANKRIKLPEQKEFEEGLEPIETAKRLDDFYRGWNAYDTAVKELNNIKEDTDE